MSKCPSGVTPLQYLKYLEFCFNILPYHCKQFLHRNLPNYLIEPTLLGLQIKNKCCNKYYMYFDFIHNYFCNFCYKPLYNFIYCDEYIKRVCSLYNYTNLCLSDCFDSFCVNIYDIK